MGLEVIPLGPGGWASALVLAFMGLALTLLPLCLSDRMEVRAAKGVSTWGPCPPASKPYSRYQGHQNPLPGHQACMNVFPRSILLSEG